MFQKHTFELETLSQTIVICSAIKVRRETKLMWFVQEVSKKKLWNLQTPFMSESQENLNLLFENIRRKTMPVACRLITYAGLSTARGAVTNQIKGC